MCNGTMVDIGVPSPYISPASCDDAGGVYSVSCGHSMSRSRVHGLLIIMAVVGSAAPPLAALQLHVSLPADRPGGHPPVGSVRVTPGAEYKAGSLHRLFAGVHWRDMWATEFEAPVLDLDAFAGGLTPTKKGGSLQTLNLRFIGRDGREYKFRSLNKDGKRTLPPELQESIVADIYQDQISIGNPMAAIVAAPLLDAVGVLNAAPRLVVMPSSNKLGEYQNAFAGILGTIEEHPRAGKKNEPGFADAEEIIDGFGIFEKLHDDPDHHLDQREFLKARLMDVLMGDRDRHADQWRWAGYKDNGRWIWRPIPRDRDFAFGRYDGVFPWAAGLVVHSAVGFGETYPSLRELTWIGRHLDRRFLNALDKSVWDSTAAFLQSRLTDSVLLAALEQMPPEMFRVGAAPMFEMLRSRRDKLGEAADEMYGLLADVVDIYGTDKAEQAEIRVMNDSSVRVQVFTKKSGTLLYSRNFSRARTSEIRLYLLGGDDRATIEGEGRCSIRVRVIGGEGKDEVVENSKSFRVDFYDNDPATTFTGASMISLHTQQSDTLFDERRPEPPVEDRYRVVRALPFVSFASDDGVLLGGYADLTQYGFRVAPYAFAADLTARFAPRFHHYDVRLFARWNTVLERGRMELLLAAGNLGLVGFYGLGNETAFNNGLADNDFYRTNYERVRIEPTLIFDLSRQFAVHVGAAFEYANAEVTGASFLAQALPYGLGNHSALALSAACGYDARDNPLAPTTGIALDLAARFYPALLGYDFAFSKLTGDFRACVPVAPDVVLALHAGGEKTFGTHPFYHAAMIGSAATVRGFVLNRFAGDASLFGQSEMRVAFGHVNLFVPARLGLTFFGDAGRVFLAGEHSTQWHSAFGGGVWLNFVNRFVLNFSVARSPENVRVYVMSGFGF